MSGKEAKAFSLSGNVSKMISEKDITEIMKDCQSFSIDKYTIVFGKKGKVIVKRGNNVTNYGFLLEGFTKEISNVTPYRDGEIVCVEFEMDGEHKTIYIRPEGVVTSKDDNEYNRPFYDDTIIH